MCIGQFFHIESIAEMSQFLSLLIVGRQIYTSENILPHLFLCENKVQSKVI